MIYEKPLFYFVSVEDHLEQIRTGVQELISLDNPREKVDSEFAHECEWDLGAINERRLPLGTILLSTMELLDEIYSYSESVMHRWGFEQEIAKKWDSKEYKKKYAFIADIRLLHSLLSKPREWERTRNILSYIHACSQHSDLCTITHLADFSETINAHLISSEDIYLNCYGHRLSDYSPENIYEKLKTKHYSAATVNGGRSAADLSPSMAKSFQKFKRAVLKNGKIHPRIHSYEIHTFLDLILASLQEFFRYKKIIKRCEHCGKFYIPLSRSDTKYCNNSSPENDARTCKEQVKYMQQKVNKSTLIKRLYESRRIVLYREMIYRDSRETKDRYEQFKKGYRDFVIKISNGEATEADLQRWLSSYYKRSCKITANDE